jgi:hypothetical protein
MPQCTGDATRECERHFAVILPRLGCKSAALVALASSARGFKIFRPAVAQRKRANQVLHTIYGSFWEQPMSVFGKIMSAIFGHSATAAPTGGVAPADAAPSSSGSAAAPAPSGAAPSASTPAAPPQSVDVAAIVDKAAAAKHEKLEWRTSIVDLMKALDIDSSLAARKELAKELGYSGDTNDSASMNVWLHKQVMAKLAANGGKLPPEIKH